MRPRADFSTCRLPGHASWRACSSALCCSASESTPLRIARCSGALQALGVVLLLHTVFPPAGDAQLPSPLRQARDWWRLSARLSDNLVYVATADGWPPAVIGSVEVLMPAYLQRVEPGLSPADVAKLQPYMGNLAVHPDARRSGIGRRLIEAAVAELSPGGDASAPGRRVYLQVDTANAAALRMYEAAGFARIRTSRPSGGHAMMEHYLQDDAEALVASSSTSR